MGRRGWMLLPAVVVLLLSVAGTPASARVAGKFAFIHAERVYVKQTATPSVRPVQVSGAGARAVAITMDAAKVVWTTTGTAVAVRVRDSAATKPVRTFSVPGSAASVTPAWFGASGLRIGIIVSRYVRDGSAPRDRLAWMNADGSGATLTYDAAPGTIDVRKLSWGSGGMLFAMQQPGSSVRDLYAYRPGNDTLVRITDAAATGHTSYSQGVWSRGGGKIAAVVDGRIVVMNPDGSGQQIGPPGLAPSFSPDGQTLAYIRPADGTVHAVSIAFTGDRLLASSAATDLSW